MVVLQFAGPPLHAVAVEVMIWGSRVGGSGVSGDRGLVFEIRGLGF